MTQRRTTRSVEMSARAVSEGIVTLPEGITYLAMAGHVNGEFPHAADPEGCDASLLITFRGLAMGADQMDLWCTREEAHEGQHVAHIRRGQPVVAWTDEEVRR